MNDSPRQCYVILETERDEHGYIPCLVVEDVAGYSPMIGQGELSTPWYWGKTMERAQQVADRYNKDHFKLSPKSCMRIMSSSMRAQNKAAS